MTIKMAAPVSQEECLQNYKYLFSPDLLRGKVAFVTGGGSGIGFTITEVLLRHGCNVVIASRNEERLKLATNTLEEATGKKCHYVKMDVRKPQDVERAVDEIMDKYGKIDILINNAAGNFLCPLSQMSYNAYKTVLEIDTIGTFSVSKAVYQKSLQRRGGTIVNITATLHYRGQILQAHAGSAKAAIDALTKHMAVEWGPDQVQVVGVAPGPIDDTEGMKRLAGEHRGMVKDVIPLQRLGRRVDIAHTVLFLVSEAGSLVSGETVVVDGGASLSAPNFMNMGAARMAAAKKASKL